MCVSRLESFPDALSVNATREALGVAFSKWSDVAPLSFTEVRRRDADITIGTAHPGSRPQLLSVDSVRAPAPAPACVCVRQPPSRRAFVCTRKGFYALNHSDCGSSPLHPCFDGVNGELAHAFLPPRGEIHFDKDELWIVGRSRFSWRRGTGPPPACAALAPPAHLGFCAQARG